jgi:hypothetical protein
MGKKIILIMGIVLFIPVGFIWIVNNELIAQDSTLSHTVNVSETIYAQGLSRADIQAAINQASPGDTVELPAGTNYNFSGTVKINVPYIHVKGAGKASTRLELGSDADGRYNPMFDITADGVELSRLTLKAFHSYRGWSGALRIRWVKDYKIHDCKFTGSDYYCIGIWGYPADGVIYDCDITDGVRAGDGLGYGIVIFGHLENEGSEGNASYSSPLDLGTLDGVYIEDCTFSNCRHYIATGAGARWVARYNIFDANCSSQPEQVMDCHGPDYGGTGTRKFEVYENTIIRPSNGNIWALIFKAGQGVIFNNTVTGLSEQSNFLFVGHPCCGTNDCGDYPLPYQFTNTYIWGNSVNGGSYNTALQVSKCDDERDQPYFVKNRDWFDYPRPDYEPLIYPHPLRTSPFIVISKSSLSFEAAEGGINPPNQTFRLLNIGVGMPNWSISDNAGWLSCLPISGQGETQINVLVNSSGLSQGTYQAKVTIDSVNAINPPNELQVNLNVFSNLSYNLTIFSNTGLPASGDGGTTNPAPGVHSYSNGSNIQLTALPYANFRFSHWTGDVNPSSEFIKSLTLYMNSDKSLTAGFCSKCGDINGDLSITPGDAQRAFDLYLGRIQNPTECELENADVNCDGTKTAPKVTPRDAQLVFNKFLGLADFPSDCSGTSRADIGVSRVDQKISSGLTHITIDNHQQISKDYVLIPVLISAQFDLKAFGFDLCYPSDIYEFIAVDDMTASNAPDYFDVNEIAEGILRIGGFTNNSLLGPTTMIITLAFRAKRDEGGLVPIRILNTVDDLANSLIKIGSIPENIDKNSSRQELVPFKKDSSN